MSYEFNLLTQTGTVSTEMIELRRADATALRGIVERSMPEVHDWLHTNTRHPWQYQVESALEPWGVSMRIRLYVIFEDMADAALFRVYYTPLDW